MKRRYLVLSVALMVGAARAAFSTTVIAPTFDELVSQAELIFVGETVDQQSAWETHGEHRNIVTIVTFDVSQVLKGQVGLRTQLTFAGGTVGDLHEEISDMPRFQVGDRDVLFVSSEKNTVSPLVGFSYGRFRVQADADGNRIVRTAGGRPLLLGLGNGRLRASSASTSGPLTLADFESAVRDRVRGLRVR